MRVWIGKLSGSLTEGDTVFLHWIGSKGGRNSGGHIVVPGDTITSIRDGLIQSCNNYLLKGEQEVQARGDDSLMIMTNRDDGDFVTEVTEAKTETFVVEKL